MALLAKKYFSKVNKERNSIHEPVASGYSVFSYSGKTIFQIDTYGTRSRQIHGKISQSIQIDEDMAKILVKELQKTFKLT